MRSLCRTTERKARGSSQALRRETRKIMVQSNTGSKVVSASLKGNRLSGLKRELVRKYNQVGFVGTIKHVSDKLAHDGLTFFRPTNATPDEFDQRYGTDTGGIIGVGTLDIAERDMEHSMHYGPISEDEFTRIMQNFSFPCEKLVFIDIGSGKGRALFLASFYPFKKIVGVEISTMLHEAAQSNLAIFRDDRQQCHDIEILCQNGATFPIPKEPLLIFLCNPFDDQVMRLVISHIEDSLREEPREVYIWYVKPCYRAVLDTTAFLDILQDTGRYVIYRANLEALWRAA